MSYRAAFAGRLAGLSWPKLLEIPMNTVRPFLRDESAIAVTEYGLLVALVAVLLIGVVTIFGSSIKSWFAARTATITTV
jgi:pilus assembly protein Flp/PilA